MDIGKLVNYEYIHEYRATFPNSDRYCGITLGLRSESSETSKNVVRKHLNDSFQVKGRQRKQTAEAIEIQELEKVASTIAWWKWEKSDPSEPGKDDGEMATYNGRENPELTMNLAVEILQKVNWLYAQIKVAGTDVENFMEKKPENVSATI